MSSAPAQGVRHPIGSAGGGNEQQGGIVIGVREAHGNVVTGPMQLEIKVAARAIQHPRHQAESGAMNGDQTGAELLSAKDGDNDITGSHRRLLRGPASGRPLMIR